jgi:hypothetical protein
MAVFWDVAPCSPVQIDVRSFYQNIRHKIPEDIHLHRRNNLDPTLLESFDALRSIYACA